MNKARPIIHETAEELKRMMHQERHASKYQRLHALYLLASGQAHGRSDVAAHLGLNRNTIGSWLALYANGGLAALLVLYVPAGKRPALTREQVHQLHDRLTDDDGFASYAAICQWIGDTFGVTMSYNAVYKLVHDTLQARPKVARPSHEKKG